MWLVRVIWYVLCTACVASARPDEGHASHRRLGERYRRRRQQVKNFWIIAGLVVMMEPVLYFAVAVSLFTTFLSFMYLDEAGSDSC